MPSSVSEFLTIFLPSVILLTLSYVLCRTRYINQSNSHKNEQVLQESGTRYRKIFETTAVSIWEEDFTKVKAAIDAIKTEGVTDLRAYLDNHPEFVEHTVGLIKVIDVNKATLQIYGAQNKEEIFASLDYLILPESLDLFREELIAIAEGHTYFECESVTQTLQGQKLYILLTMHIPTTSEEFKCVLVSIMDITKRKQAQEALQAAYAELEERVQHRTQELAAANIRLQELDHHKDKFIEDMSHELRTPLSNLNLYLDLLDMGKPEKRSQYLATLRLAIQRLTNLSEGVLTITRLNLYKDNIQTTSLNLNEVITKVVQQQRRLVKPGVRLNFTPDPHLPSIHVTHAHMYEVVSKLLDNSLNYTPAGHIDLSTFRDETFDRFYRGQHVGQSNIPGNGLGLAVVKEIVELHGGSVEVESQKDEGCTFRVWLPGLVPPPKK